MTENKKSSNLYEEIWGHRFKDGQTSHEYMLEFLNVLRGTEYQFNSTRYFRRKSVALRQFVFKEDLNESFEKMPPEVNQAILKVLPQEQTRREFVRNLFRSYTIVERKRSWYAKFLFPVHEKLLFVELRSDKRKEKIIIERNFFARGGELYYLMLSRAKNDQAKKDIARKLRDILTKSNSAIGEIARVINETAAATDTTSSYYTEDKSFAPLEPSDRDYPYLPKGHCSYYDDMARHVQSLLKVNIEETHMLYLLTTLISLHIVNYILRRAHHSCSECSMEECIRCNPQIFVDCYMGGENSEIRRLSSKQFKRMELRIKNRVSQHLEKRLQKILNTRFNESGSMIEKYLSVEQDIKEAFYYKLLKKKNKEIIDQLLQKGQSIVAGANNDKETIDRINNLFKLGLEKVVLKQTDKNFLPIHKAISKEIGLAGYRTGENYRYTLSDNVVKVLVLSLLEPEERIEFTEFVHKVWENFGLIIGLAEAKKTGIYKESKLNIKYFEDNLEQFRIRLKNNGLLREYSDATAMVKNPYV